MSKGGFSRAAAVAAAITVLLLAFLFTVPGHYLKNMTGRLRSMTRAAEKAAVSGDMETAAEQIAEMTREYNGCRDKLKLFFHHDDLGEMDRTLRTCRDLVLIGQNDNLICEINSILAILDHMDAVETLTVTELF